MKLPRDISGKEFLKRIEIWAIFLPDRQGAIFG